MRVVAIIQARMGSTRLPGKVMLDLAGTPVIDRVVQRVARVSGIDEIVVATTVNAEDDALVAHLASLPVLVSRGSPEDVLDRYHAAALQTDASVIVRITSDCPLLSPTVSGRVVARFLADRDRVDYVSNTLDRSYPRGLDTEVFHRSALTAAWREAVAAPDREHVTPFIYRHPDRFRLSQVTGARDLSGLRWTLDTLEDYELLRRIFDALGDTPSDMPDVLDLLDQHPSWVELNATIRQKAYGE